jgi:high-affinity Fe2+/Pb2+ permease
MIMDWFSLIGLIGANMALMVPWLLVVVAVVAVMVVFHRGFGVLSRVGVLAGSGAMGYAAVRFTGSGVFSDSLERIVGMDADGWFGRIPNGLLLGFLDTTLVLSSIFLVVIFILTLCDRI